ncbi:RHS repeat-associated core domain-containing protein [Burkholderia sp. Bp9004]|nr:RHS repeat-associated core domain-containing protein [Burkholderia sp. Bp9004]
MRMGKQVIGWVDMPAFCSTVLPESRNTTSTVDIIQIAQASSGPNFQRIAATYDPQVGRYITQDPIELAGGLNVYQYALNPISWIDSLGLQTGPVLLGMGNLYRASTQPPLPTLSRSTSIRGIYGDVSNLAFPSPVLPGEWVGVNVQWSMPTIKQYYAKEYFGDSSLGMTDNSGRQCRRQPDFQTQSIVPEGWSDRRKFTCTEWFPYDSAI